MRRTNKSDVGTSSYSRVHPRPSRFSFSSASERHSGRASAKTMALISAGHNARLAGVSWPIKRGCRPPSTCLPASRRAQRGALAARHKSVFECASMEARSNCYDERRNSAGERASCRAPRYFGNEQPVIHCRLIWPRRVAEIISRPSEIVEYQNEIVEYQMLNIKMTLTAI